MLRFKRSSYLRFMCLCGVAMIGFVPNTFAETELPRSEALLNASAETVSDSIQLTLQSPGVSKDYFKDINALQVFYDGRGYEPYWVNRFGVSGRADDLLEFIEESWDHGINPYSYHLDNIRLLMDQRDVQNLADLDLLLSDAYLRLAQDLTGIRVNPVSLDTNKRFWRAPLLADDLFARLSGSYDVEDLMESFEPQGQTYNRLRKEFREVSQEPPEPYEDVLPIRMQGLLHPYEYHPRVPDLRLRLGLDADVQDPLLYDDALAAEIIEFQRENSLKPDGIIGRQTLEILNIKREQKLHQLIANMERLRWVEEDKPDKFVVVNIPSATLWAIDDGRVEFEMPVIVGRKKRPTNMFITEIHGVRFNPTWTVPPTIKKEDILPKLQEDPEHLMQKGMELVLGRGEEAVTIDPTSVDWLNITEEELKAFRMVQMPGGNNPLGSVRVLMPNRYNIYLHDTNTPQDFIRAARALSSGCVRLKEPERMASFIMRERKGWDDYTMEEIFGEQEMKDLYVAQPIPVYLLYYTVWVNEEGDLVYGHDLYDYDNKLIKMLSNLDGFLIPVDNNENIEG